MRGEPLPIGAPPAIRLRGQHDDREEHGPAERLGVPLHAAGRPGGEGGGRQDRGLSKQNTNGWALDSTTELECPPRGHYIFSNTRQS